MNQQLLAFLEGPARSWVVSQGYAVWSIVTFAVALAFTSGVVKDFHSLFAFLYSSQFAFSLFLSLVLGIGPYARAAQGAARVASQPVDPVAATPQKVTPA